MCIHDTLRPVSVIHPRKKQVLVDACIAEEVQELNNKGIKTVGSCCGHGNAGRPVTYENGFGVWKTYELPPHVLIDKDSKSLAEQLGYRPYPYYYADGTYHDTMIMILKTGCITEEECLQWKL